MSAPADADLQAEMAALREHVADLEARLALAEARIEDVVSVLLKAEEAQIINARMTEAVVVAMQGDPVSESGPRR